MNRNNKEYNAIYESFYILRNFKNQIKEDINPYIDGLDENDAVPYSQQDEIFENNTKSAKEIFHASFDGIESPILFYPNNNDVTFTGKIPSLGNDAIFKFRYKDASGNGCFLWCDQLILSDDNLQTLSRMLGFFKNWKNELDTSEDITPISIKTNGETPQNSNISPGDDVEMYQ